MNCFQNECSLQIALAQAWIIWNVPEWVRMLEQVQGGVTLGMNGVGEHDLDHAELLELHFSLG